MKKIVKKSIQEKAYEALRSECLSGEREGKLPGARTLAASLGVSQFTMLKAMSALAAEGLLIRSGNKRAYQVNPNLPTHLKSKSTSREKSILILTPAPLEDLNQTTRRLMKRLKSSLAEQEWKMKELVVDYSNANNHHKSWDRMIGIDENSPIIAVCGTPALADWAAHHKRRILFIGGLLEGRVGTMVSVSSTKIAIEAMDSLIALGHRRIILPLNGRPESVKASLMSALKSKIEDLGEVYQASYHNPESPYFSREVAKDMMMMYAKSTLPTAIIFLDWGELLATYCCFSEMSLRVPEDISLILLNDQTEATWFSPDLTRYTFPLDGYVKAFNTWLHEPNSRPKEILLSPTLIKGASIAPPSK